MIRRYLLASAALLLGLLPAAPLAGEEEISYVTTEVAAPILSVEDLGENLRRVIVGLGAEDGLVVGWRGQALAVRSDPEDIELNSEPLGYAEVTETVNRYARVRVSLTDPTGARVVKVGDVVVLKARVPDLPERSILWDLLRKRIRLKGSGDSDAWFEYRDFYRDEAPLRVRALMNLMVAKIRKSGRDYGSYEALQQVLDRGRYRGRKPAEVLTGATREELDTFLRFVVTFPGKYYGKLWSVDEIFATWVINGAPYSTEEVMAELLGAPTLEARSAILLERRDELDADERDTVVRRLRGAAEAASREDAFEEARANLATARAAARTFDLPEQEGKELFTGAYILGEEGRAKECVETYRRAIAVFLAAPEPTPADRTSAASCAHNMGLALDRLGDYEGALAAYRTALEEYRTSGAGAWNLGLTLRVQGDLLRKMGRYVEALAAYDEAVPLFARLDARTGLDKALTGRAKTLEPLGRNAEAARAYQDLLAEQRRVGDREGEAETLENIGSQNWSLGDYRRAVEAYTESLAIRRETGDRGAEAITLVNLGRLLTLLTEYDEAKAKLEAALAMERELGRKSYEADALVDLGTIAGNLGAYEDALRLFEEALGLQREASSRTGQAYVMLEIGNLRWRRSEYEESLAAYDQAVRLYEEAGARADTAIALRSRGNTFQLLKRYPEAMADLKRAASIHRESGSPGAEAEVLIEIGWLYWNRSEADRALAETKRALAMAEEIGNLTLKAKALVRLGEIHAWDYRAADALRAYDRAAVIYESPLHPDPRGLARIRNLRAGVTANQGRFEAALPQYEEALQLARSCGATEEMRDALVSIGVCQYMTGKVQDALETFRKAEEAVRSNPWLLAQTLENTAETLSQMGQGRRAVEVGGEALAIRIQLRNEEMIAVSKRLLAEIMLKAGDREGAHASIEEAIRTLPENANPWNRGSVLITAGEIDLDAGQPETALRRFEEALGIFRTLEVRFKIAESLLYVGKAYRLMGTPESRSAADVALREAEEIYGEVGVVLTELGVLTERARLALDAGDGAFADVIATSALPRIRATGSPHLLWEILEVRSRAREKQGRLAEALEDRRAAIETLQELRAGLGGDGAAERKFLRSRIRIYESMANLLGHLIETETDQERRKALMEEALGFVSRAHFEILSEDTRGVESTGSEVVDELLKDIERARKEIGRIQDRIEEARKDGNRELAEELTRTLATTREELAELHANLKAADPDFAARCTGFDPRWVRTEGVLPEGARLLVTFTGETDLYLWVFSRDGFLAWKRHTISREEIGRLVSEFRGLMDEMVAKSGGAKGRGFGPAAEASEHNPAWYRENARKTREVLTELHRRLIDPVAAEIADADPLLILPYGRLNYLPFEALMDGDGRFLGEKCRIAYLLHRDQLQQTLARLDRPPPGGPDVWIGYADPVGNLAESLEESAEIQAFFPEHEVHSRLTGTATEGDLRKLREDGTILHFATHGFLNGERPGDTYLEMASPPGDGKLMQKEVYGLTREVPPLRAKNIRLVVLSACETARAATAPEAEVLGLPDAFSFAGAPAVIASLWSVYSWSTTDLMVEFYRRLTTENVDLAGALLGARRSLLENRETARYAHPYYWSPFLLYGDWR